MHKKTADHRPAALVAATAGLAPAPRRRGGIRSNALRRLAQTESARWVPHQGGILMDCPRRRLRFLVYYNNSFLPLALLIYCW
jgi:hypothetical protein